MWRQKLFSFCKSHAVLLIASAAAAVSCFLVPPDREYLFYPDYKVLCLLFCLMAAVAGLQKANVFTLLSEHLGAKIHSVRMLGLFLTLLCFFSAMFITNDVALITFVPFAVLVLSAAKRKDLIVYTVTLQTIAANLGSMATPVGNPQNLYLYEHYQIPTGKFFSLTLPLTALSLILLLLCWLFIPARPVSVGQNGERSRLHKKEFLLHTLLFLLSLLCVLRILDFKLLTAVVLILLLIFDRSILRRVDYGLLFTFLAFFVFVGNLTRMERVSEILSGLLERAPFSVSVLFSQIISNVPAAMLLSGFTENGAALVLGTNVGGLGTLIASLASLISFGEYGKSPDAAPFRYLLVFTGMNLLFLGILYSVSLLLL